MFVRAEGGGGDAFLLHLYVRTKRLPPFQILTADYKVVFRATVKLLMSLDRAAWKAEIDPGITSALSKLKNAEGSGCD